MIAEERQFTKANELATYLQTLITAGKTISMVVPLAHKSWYLIIRSA